MYARSLPYFIVIMAFSAAVSVYSPCITSLAAELGLEPQNLDWLSALLAVGFFTMIPFCYRWAPRLNKDLVLFWGTVSLTASLFLPTWFALVPIFIVTAYALGAGSGIIEIVATAALADSVEPARRRALLNFSQVFYCVGAVGAPIFFGFLFEREYGWRVGFRIIGVLCVVSAVAMLWHARRIGAPRAARPATRSRLRDLLHNRTLVALIVGLLLYVSGEMGYAQWVPTYFEEVLGASKRVASWALSLFWIGQFTGRAFYGLVHVKFSDRASIAAFTALCLLATAPILVSRDVRVGLVCIFLVGLGCSICWPTIMSLISRAETRHADAAISLAIGVGALGYTVGPPLVGRVTDLSGSFRIGMLAMSTLMVANIVLFLVHPGIRRLEATR